jgi:hypothetical protein
LIGLVGASPTAVAQSADGSLSIGGLPVVWGGLLTLTLQSDQTLNETGGVKPFNNTYSEPELEWYVNVGQTFSINGLAKMEQVRTRTDDGAFRDEGAWIEQLYGTVWLDPVQMFGGKIHPRLGRAWDVTPGLFGTDFAEDYELADKIGVGAAVDIRAAGIHSLAFEAFFADTSWLSNSALARPSASDPLTLRPGRLKREDGGVSNTGELNNFAVTLTGRRIPQLTGLTYQLGWGLQRGSEAGAELDEKTYLASLEWEIPVSGRLTATPLIEYARVENQGGADIRADYITAAVGIDLGLGWSAAVHTTVKPVHDRAAADDYVDYLAGASVGYDLGAILKRRHPLLAGLGVEAGYKRERIVRENLNTLGIAFTYERAF